MADITLAQVEAAITTVLSGGQRYSLPNGIMVERANLDRLMELRRTMQAEVSQTNNGGSMMRPVGFGRVT
jgi:hypothetical protein